MDAAVGAPAALGPGGGVLVGMGADTVAVGGEIVGPCPIDSGASYVADRSIGL